MVHFGAHFTFLSHGEVPKCRGAQGNLPHLLPLDRPALSSQSRAILMGIFIMCTPLHVYHCSKIDRHANTPGFYPPKSRIEIELQFPLSPFHFHSSFSPHFPFPRSFTPSPFLHYLFPVFLFLLFLSFPSRSTIPSHFLSPFLLAEGTHPQSR